MFLPSQGLLGVFIGTHAIAEGVLTPRQLREGPYPRVLRGSYADPSLPRAHLLRCRAAALLMPASAALGGRSAAVGALAGLPAPIPQYEAAEGRHWLGRVDLAWPEARLIVEYEGEHHLDGLQIVRDDVRALIAHGDDDGRRPARAASVVEGVVGRPT